MTQLKFSFSHTAAAIISARTSKPQHDEEDLRPISWDQVRRNATNRVHG